jgi:hypothetical protein
MGLIMIIVTGDGNLDPTRRDLAERARHGIQQIARRADDGEQEERAGDMTGIRPFIALPR